MDGVPAGGGGGGGSIGLPISEPGIGPGFRLETWDQGFFFNFCDIKQIGNFFAKLVEFTLLNENFRKFPKFFGGEKIETLICEKKNPAWDACVFSSLISNLFRY